MDNLVLLERELIYLGLLDKAREIYTILEPAARCPTSSRVIVS